MKRHPELFLVVIYVVVVCAWLGCQIKRFSSGRGCEVAKSRPVLSAEHIGIGSHRIDNYVGVPINNILVFRGRKKPWLNSRRIWYALQQLGSKWALVNIRECTTCSLMTGRTTLINEVRPTTVYILLYDDDCRNISGWRFPGIDYGDWKRHCDLSRRLVSFVLNASGCDVHPCSLIGSHFMQLIFEDKASENGNRNASQSEDGHNPLKTRQPPPSFFAWVQLACGLIFGSFGWFFFLCRFDRRGAIVGLPSFAIGMALASHGAYLLI